MAQAINATIEPREGEEIDFVLRRFKKACQRGGVFNECRARRGFESDSARKRKRRLDAHRRQRRYNLRRAAKDAAESDGRRNTLKDRFVG